MHFDSNTRTPTTPYKSILLFFLAIFALFGFYNSVITSRREGKIGFPLVVLYPDDAKQFQKPPYGTFISTNFKSYFNQTFDNDIINKSFNIISMESCHNLCNEVLQKQLIGNFYSTQECSPMCSDVVFTSYAPFRAHMTALVSGIVNLNKTDLVVISLVDSQIKQSVSEILEELQIDKYSFVFASNETDYISSMVQILNEKNNSPILFTSGRAMFDTLKYLDDRGALERRAIFAYLNTTEQDILEASSEIRSIAEKVGLFISSSKTKPSSALDEIINNFHSVIIKPRWEIAIERLVPRELIGTAIFQQHPWLIDSIFHLEKIHNASKVKWKIAEYFPLPYKLILKKEITELISSSCSPIIEIKSVEPFSKYHYEKQLSLDQIPPVIMLPNSNEAGYGIKITCKQNGTLNITELQCSGSKLINEPINCLLATGGIHRRHIRSYVSHHHLHIDRQDIEDQSEIAKERLKAIMPQIGGCVGATMGCSICFLFLLHTPVRIYPGVCYGACSAAVGGSCTNLLLTRARNELDTTVICTEMFRQRRIGASSYIADAKFGAKLSKCNPTAFLGYSYVAAPIVRKMRISRLFSDFVQFVSKPWIEHMEYTEKLRESDNNIGYIINHIGIILCFIIGFFITYLSIFSMLLTSLLVCLSCNKYIIYMYYKLIHIFIITITCV